ncbi:MAG: hypothetical protein AB7S26_33100 [Sandaracinaceae bacterium]
MTPSRYASLVLFLFGSFIAACGSTPVMTETTTTTRVQRPEGGGEIRRTSTETREVEEDGSQTTETNVSTQSSVPPSQQ